MTYAEQPETTLTSAEIRAMRVLLSRLTLEQVSELADVICDVCGHGTGDVTLEVRHSKVRFLKRTYLEDWWH